MLRQILQRCPHLTLCTKTMRKKKNIPFDAVNAQDQFRTLALINLDNICLVSQFANYKMIPSTFGNLSKYMLISFIANCILQWHTFNLTYSFSSRCLKCMGLYVFNLVLHRTVNKMPMAWHNNVYI